MFVLVFSLEAIGDKRRKYDNILVDLDTSISLFKDGRKIIILEKLNNTEEIFIKIKDIQGTKGIH